MKIEKNKIRLLIYIFTISIVLFLIIFLIAIFMKSSSDQSTEKIDQITSNIYDMKKLYIKDIVNITIQDIETERKIVKKEKIESIRKILLEIERLNNQVTTFEELIDKIYKQEIFFDDIKVIIYNGFGKKVEYKFNMENIKLENITKDKLEISLNENFIYEYIELNENFIYVCVDKKDIDNYVKEIVGNLIRERKYLDDGYLWVNDILDFNGGDDYAVRLIHPNMKDTEGMLLSTNTEDILGNLPYKLELDGINESGEIFYEYYFKKMDSDKIERKLSYAKLYKPFNWIIATGIYLDDIDMLIINESIRAKEFESELINKIFLLVIICLILAIGLIIIFERSINNLILKFQNIVNQKNNELICEKKLIEEIAYFDPLTSLLNRRAMDIQLENSFSRAIRYKENFSIIIGDIDFFKKVNDMHGHVAGDLVIKTISDVIKSNVRNDDYVSRWGGEEFLILLNYSSKEETIKNLNRIINAINKTEVLYEGKKIKCTLSFGLASYSEEIKTVAKIIRLADENLYKAKKNGRNRIVY